MKHRRVESFLMVAVLLAVNFFTLLWLQGRPFAAAWASALGAPAAAPQAVTIPSTFSYQGTLRDASGNLLNGPVNLTLKLYAVVTGGNALHTESFANVNVRNGVFSVVVGDNTPLAPTVFDNAPLYLGISVNSDAEMLPRQRLHPVPWAMQSSTALTAVTANNLAPGGGVPNIVSFGAGGASEIAFAPNGGKITNSATGMTLTGGANQKVTTAGALAVGGDLTVAGNWNAGAILDKGDSNGGANQRSTYPVSINRYVIEAPDNGASPDTVPLDDALLMQLCGDEDGCTFTLGMRNWEPARPTDAKAMLASVGPARFSISPAVQGKRWWSSRNWTGGAGVSTPADNGVASDAQDGDGGINHVARAWDCYFTDTKYVNAVSNDTQLGFGLLNWHAQYLSTDMTCVLIIED